LIGPDPGRVLSTKSENGGPHRPCKAEEHPVGAQAGGDSCQRDPQTQKGSADTINAVSGVRPVRSRLGAHPREVELQRAGL